MKLPLIVIGAGGHATVVADALLSAGERVLGFTDRDSSRHGRELCGLRVLGDDRVLESHSPETVMLANGVGSVGKENDTQRRDLQHALQARGWRFATVRHPATAVSSFARIGEGVQLMAASVVNAGAHIGEGCIVNTGAVVEHDVSLGAWVHVAPRALLCGGVLVGSRSHIGAGAVVRQGVRLGEGTVVGAGAVVISDFVDGGLLIGAPARRVELQA